jgi:hypothetical protein
MVGLLAARAPELRKAVRDAKKAGYAYVVLDGTLIPVDRVAADRPSCSGKHRRHPPVREPGRAGAAAAAFTRTDHAGPGN